MVAIAQPKPRTKNRILSGFWPICKIYARILFHFFFSQKYKPAARLPLTAQFFGCASILLVHSDRFIDTFSRY
jgi:hypothetical protein